MFQIAPQKNGSPILQRLERINSDFALSRIKKMSSVSVAKLYTLVYVKRTVYVLLGLKQRGFGVGRWNGFGGKVNTGESIQLAAIRELQEECGLKVTGDQLNYRGLLEIEFDDNSMAVEVFTTEKFEGEPKDTEEMKPKWFHTDKLPLSDMWPDNRDWISHVLQGNNFKANYKYDKNGQLLKGNVTIIPQSKLPS